MSEKFKNRKWVTKAIIVFVACLALLTFFSNTIMNLMIPKVVGKRAVRGNLSYTNNSSAVVEPVTSYRVKGIEGRVIDQVLISDYDEVAAGDVLMTLNPVEDQSELDELRAQLTTLQREADYAARTPDETDYDTMRAGITSAQVSLDEARDALNAARGKSDKIAAANTILEQNRPLAVSLSAEVDSASTTLESINSQISTLQSEIGTREDQIETLENLGVPTPTPTPLPVQAEPGEEPGEGEEPVTPSQGTIRIGELRAEIEERRIRITELQSQLSSAQSRLDEASSRLADCNAAIEEAESAIETAEGLPSVSSARSSVETAQAGLTSAQRALANAQTTAGIERDKARDEASDRAAQITKLQTQIAELEANLNATEIKAPAAGQIFALAVDDGDTMEKDSVILIIVPDVTEYTASFKFPTASITGLQPGMELTSDEYWLDSCRIISIKPDPESPRESRIVKCSLEAEYILPGETISVVANRSNQDYDHIVSSGAINEDNSGTFVYMISENRSPFGNTYTVHRVDVSVEATDGAMSAISGDGLDEGMVVIRSDEALEDGQRVRLEDAAGK
ncbi:MAG: hypothetical protein IKE53_08525 [Clostridiales bacterium]|nr:hypothetical protein [Clostridiales bacterium]